MRKLSLLVTLMVASAFFLAAAPTPASAGNCTNIHANQPFLTPSGQSNYARPTFTASVGSCVSVNRVRYGFQGINAGYAILTGNSPSANYAPAYAQGGSPNPILSSPMIEPTCNGCAPTSAQYVFNNPCGVNNTQWLPGFSFQIESINYVPYPVPHSTYTWGGWADVSSYQWFNNPIPQCFLA